MARLIIKIVWATGTIGKGNIQWMTSGSGILHEEMPKEPKEGIMEGFQLWLNLPAKLKMTSPATGEFYTQKSLK